MSEDIFAEDRQDAKPKSKAGRFDQISIALHWLTVILVAMQFSTAWLANQRGADAAMLLFVHRSTGTLTWAVVAMRFMWRHCSAHLPPFPPRMPKLQQQIAKLSEYALYGLLLVQPLTGLGNTLFRNDVPDTSQRGYGGRGSGKSHFFGELMIARTRHLGGVHS